MALTERAAALTGAVERSHQGLLKRAGGDSATRQGLQAVREAISAAFDDLDDARLSTPPSAEEWSMAEVVEHIAEHDRKYEELVLHGPGHYVEHGLEHALQLWRLRGAARASSA